MHSESKIISTWHNFGVLFSVEHMMHIHVWLSKVDALPVVLGTSMASQLEKIKHTIIQYNYRKKDGRLCIATGIQLASITDHEESSWTFELQFSQASWISTWSWWALQFSKTSCYYFVGKDRQGQKVDKKRCPTSLINVDAKIVSKT